MSVSSKLNPSPELCNIFMIKGSNTEIREVCRSQTIKKKNQLVTGHTSTRVSIIGVPVKLVDKTQQIQ